MEKGDVGGSLIQGAAPRSEDLSGDGATLHGEGIAGHEPQAERSVTNKCLGAGKKTWPDCIVDGDEWRFTLP